MHPRPEEGRIIWKQPFGNPLRGTGGCLRNKKKDQMKKLAVALAVISAFTFNSYAGDKMDHKKMGHAKSIYDTAASTEMFSTLTAAIKAGGKKEMLQEDKGPFTVFAPNDAAFKKLPEGTLQDLLKPENKEKLAKILAYHVVPGKVMATDVKTREADTAEGSKLDVKVDDGQSDGRRCECHQNRHPGEQWCDPRDRHRADAAGSEVNFVRVGARARGFGRAPFAFR